MYGGGRRCESMCGKSVQIGGGRKGGRRWCRRFWGKGEREGWIMKLEELRDEKNKYKGRCGWERFGARGKCGVPRYEREREGREGGGGRGRVRDSVYVCVCAKYRFLFSLSFACK